jgi:hypothetical protein
MPMYYGHELGYVIRRLRELRLGGARAGELRAYLKERLPIDDAYRTESYLSRAFMQPLTAVMSAFPPGPIPEAKENSTLLDRHRSGWANERYPELMRVRDYVSFLEFARDEQVIVIVCTSNPFAGDFIGRRGYRAFAGRLHVISNETGPDRGLISADPGDSRLISALSRYAPPLSYEEYVARLEQLGYRVRRPAERYLIEDGDGAALYEGYRLHGAYDVGNGSPVWTAKRGEKLRAALNRRFGEELVHFGTHDEWQYRNDPAVAGPLYGPQLPAIAFNPENEIDALLTINDMGWGIPQIEQHWTRLYPHHPVTK